MLDYLCKNKTPTIINNEIINKNIKKNEKPATIFFIENWEKKTKNVIQLKKIVV